MRVDSRVGDEIARGTSRLLNVSEIFSTLHRTAPRVELGAEPSVMASALACLLSARGPLNYEKLTVVATLLRSVRLNAPLYPPRQIFNDYATPRERLVEPIAF